MFQRRLIWLGDAWGSASDVNAFQVQLEDDVFFLGTRYKEEFVDDVLRMNNEDCGCVHLNLAE